MAHAGETGLERGAVPAELRPVGVFVDVTHIHRTCYGQICAVIAEMSIITANYAAIMSSNRRKPATER